MTCSRLPIEKRSLAEHPPKINLGHGQIISICIFSSFSHFSCFPKLIHILIFSLQISFITIHRFLALYYIFILQIVHFYVMIFFLAFSSFCSIFHFIFFFSVFSFLPSTETTCYILASTTLLSYSLYMEVIALLPWFSINTTSHR